MHAGSASAQRVGKGEVGGVTCRLTYTWWLLSLAVKPPWLAPGGPILALVAWTGLGNVTLCYKCMTIENADHCMLVKGVGVVKVTSLLVKAGSGLRLSVLESDCTSQWPD